MSLPLNIGALLGILSVVQAGFIHSNHNQDLATYQDYGSGYEIHGVSSPSSNANILDASKVDHLTVYAKVKARKQALANVRQENPVSFSAVQQIHLPHYAQISHPFHSVGLAHSFLPVETPELQIAAPRSHYASRYLHH